MAQKKKEFFLFNWILPSSDDNNNRGFFRIVTLVLILALIVDTMINYVVDFLVSSITTGWGIAAFISIFVIFGTGQYFILDYIKRKSKEIRLKYVSFRMMLIIVTLAQHSVLIIAAILVLQILLASYFFTGMLIIGYTISHILTIALSALASFWLLSWYKSNRSSIAVLLYGIFFIVYAFSTTVVTAEHLIVLSEKEPVRSAKSEVIFPTFKPGTILKGLSNTYHTFDTVSFIIVWLATVTLLYHYSQKLGRTTFWFLISLPLAYFLSTFVNIIGIYSPTTEQAQFYFYLYISLNSTAGGVLFAVAFRAVAQSLQKSATRDYMIIAALGFILTFISNQPNLMLATYPPFGFATSSISGLSAFLILIGLYSSAVSVSQDSKLRQSIKKIATKDVDLLSSIGTAQMEQEIQRTVNSMKNVVEEQEKELEEQTGIEANLGEDEMKNYLEEVMQEIGKVKKPSI